LQKLQLINNPHPREEKMWAHYWKTTNKSKKQQRIKSDVRLHMGWQLRPYNEPKQEEQNHNNFLQEHKMLSVVWPQQPLHFSGMPEHLVCHNNHLKACHVASHEEEIYNSLYQYISIPQNVRSTRTDHNTNREVNGHHTTYNYVW